MQKKKKFKYKQVFTIVNDKDWDQLTNEWNRDINTLNYQTFYK